MVEGDVSDKQAPFWEPFLGTNMTSHLKPIRNNPVP
jgi:hypothetical protein